MEEGIRGGGSRRRRRWQVDDMPQHFVLFNQRYPATVASSTGTELRAWHSDLLRLLESTAIPVSYKTFQR
jgi:hypothetical protein